MKLELKHIAPYLSYNLKGVTDRGTIFFLSYYSNMKGEGIENRELSHFLEGNIKPILRPLSDLYKQIEESNGDDFENEFRDYVGGEWCDIYDNAIEHIIDEMYNGIHIKALPLHLIEFLLSKHFDVFGLIPEGLAIDINTL